MRRSRRSTLVALATGLTALTGACGGDASPRPAPSPAALAPTYPPTTTARPSTTGLSATVATEVPTPATGAPPQPAAATTVPPAPPLPVEQEASVSDPVGDLTPSPAERAPAWADLAGAALRSTEGGFELRVRLGAPAPFSTDSAHTMNVASFYDVDGDGDIEYQVWVNLSDAGWSGAYFDGTPGGRNRFGPASGVEPRAEGDEVVVRFPASHVRGASRFRWSVASEWGSYNVIGTPAAARDDCPDGDAPVVFPG